MSDVLAVVRVEHPDLALTETVAHDESAQVRPVREAGTDPESGAYFFSIESEEFATFETGLRADPTVDRFEQVIDLGGERIYKFEYTERAKLFSPEITQADGLALDIENVGTEWLMKVWLPERGALERLWDYADDHGIDIELERLNDYSGFHEGETDLTDAQREALLVALDAGYFEEPRESSLGEVADLLGISRPAAGGRLRRGMRRLLRSTVAEEET